MHSNVNNKLVERVKLKAFNSIKYNSIFLYTSLF